MMKSVAVGSVLVAVTIIVHAVGTMAWMKFLMGHYADRDGDWKTRDTVPVLVFTGLVLTLLHVVEVMIWAVTYRALPAITELETLEKAVYFSVVTFTTLGYGDVTLGPDWRVLSGIQAMNGIVLFGWTTALLFSVLQRTWMMSHRRPPDDAQ